MDACGLDDEVLVKARDSVHWPGLLGALQDADNRGLKPERALAALAADWPIGRERDPAAVLRARLLGWERKVGGRRRARSSMVAGLVPRAEGIADPDMARAIRECEQAIARRARELAEEALAAEAPGPAHSAGPPTIPPRAPLSSSRSLLSPPTGTVGTLDGTASSARWGASASVSSSPTATAPDAPASKPRSWQGLPRSGPRNLNPHRQRNWTWIATVIPAERAAVSGGNRQ